METVEDADEGFMALVTGIRHRQSRQSAGKRKAAADRLFPRVQAAVARALCSVLRGIGTSSLLNWGLGALPTSRRRARQS